MLTATDLTIPHYKGKDLLDEKTSTHSKRSLVMRGFSFDAYVSEFFGGDATGDNWAVL